MTAVRWTGAYWFLPALFALSCLIGASDTVRTGYPAGDIASTSYALYLAGPLTAAFVATRFRGFVRFVRPLRSLRSGLSTSFAAWWALLLGAPLVVCMAVLTTARTVPSDVASWGLLSIDFMTVLACALVGLVFTWALPIVVSVPAATALWFYWLAYGPSTNKALLHNMDSTFAACCDSATRPASVAIQATLTLTGLICLGIALLLVPGQWARASRLVIAPAVVAVLLAAFGAGAVVAKASPQTLTLQAVERRTTALECEVQASIRMCVWPENRHRVKELAGIVSDLNQVLKGWGLESVTALTQADRDHGAVSIEAGDQLSHDDLRYTIAAGYVDHVAGCIGAHGHSRDERVALISLAAGLTPAGLVGRVDGSAATVAESQLTAARSSADPVRAWFLGGIDSIRCGADG